MKKCNHDVNFAYFTCITNECTFYVVSKHNKQIYRHWFGENEQIIINSSTQYSPKLNAWGI